MVVHVEGFGHGFVDYFAIHHVDSFGKAGIAFAGFYPAHVGYAQGVGKSGICQGHGGGERYGTGDIGYGVMHYAIYFVYRVAVGRRMGCLETTTLVNGDIHHHGSLLQKAKHIPRHEIRGLSTRNQDGTYDKVGGGQFLLYVVA